MGKIFDKLMNTMRLNGDDYEEEYDDDYGDDIYEDEYDDYDDAPAPTYKAPIKKVEEPVTPTRGKTMQKTRTTGRSSKIVPIKTAQNIQEVRVIRPGNYDSSREIIDVLLEGQACIVNLEGISFDLAAQITDFIFGGCYALDGNIEKVNNFIFVITPAGLEITGDIQNLTSKPGADMTNVNYQAR